MSGVMSVVIPVYRMPYPWLRAGIESVLNQSFKDLELILVDDGSPDDCGAICDDYAAHDARVKVLHQKNSGVSEARNAGVERAAGEWVLFIDADDYLECRALSVLQDVAGRHADADVVVFSLYRDYENSTVPYRPMYPSEKEFSTQEELLMIQRDVLEAPLDRNVLVFAYCKMIRRALLAQMNPCFAPELPMCEDVEFSLRLLSRARRVVYTDQRLYHYRQSELSAVNRYRPYAEAEQERLLWRIRQVIDASPAPEQFELGYARECFYAMQRIILQGYFNPRCSLRYLEKRRGCAAAFSREPYLTALKQLDTKGLPRNHQIKAWLIRLRLYGCMSLMRNLFYRQPGKRHSRK